LHGNSLKKETAPDGSLDENVFDIRQGVAIAVCVKNNQAEEHKVFHRDLFGSREQKYTWLREHAFSIDNYELLTPNKPYYFFVRRKTEDISRYMEWKKINEIFPVNSVGIVTARDKLTIHWDKQEVWNTVLSFLNYDPETARMIFNLGNDARDWKVSLAQEDLRKSGPQKNNIVPILYRPFDVRYTYYTGKSRGFLCMPRPEVMRHMLNPNIGLCVGRQGKVVGQKVAWNLVFVTDAIVDFNLFYRGGELLMPLYLFTDETYRNLLNQEICKETNLSPIITNKLTSAYSFEPIPEDILHYIYAILYSNIYRETYAKFLEYDFPRVPFTADSALFQQMAALGKRLVDLHLLRSPELDQPIARFEGKGDDLTITTPKYDPKTKHVWVNATYYFEGITPEVWGYQIGGYQVLDKYLKARKGRSLEDPRHILRVATALAKTIEIQQEIDALYPHIESDLIEFSL